MEYGYALFATDLHAVPSTRVIDAAKAAGIEESLLSDIAPRSAFIRACRALAKDGVGKIVEENANKAMAYRLSDDAVTKFQFNPVFLSKSGANFGTEDQHVIVAFNKLTQDVECSIPRIAELVREKYAEMLGVYSTQDLNSLMKRAIGAQDAKQVMLRAGVYLVHPRCKQTLDILQDFLARIGFGAFVLAVNDVKNRDVAARQFIADLKSEVNALQQKIMEESGKNELTPRKAANKIVEFRKNLRQYKELAQSLQEPLFECLKEAGEAGETLALIGESDEQDLIAQVRQGATTNPIAQALALALQKDNETPRLREREELQEGEVE